MVWASMFISLVTHNHEPRLSFERNSNIQLAPKFEWNTQKKFCIVLETYNQLRGNVALPPQTKPI